MRQLLMGNKIITIEIPIEGDIIKVNVNDARQAVSLLKGLYLKKQAQNQNFEIPKITTFRKNNFVEKECKAIFETLKIKSYNSGGNTGSNQAKREGGEVK